MNGENDEPHGGGQEPNRPRVHLTDSSFSSVPVSLAFRSSITSALPFGHRKEN